MICNWHRHYKQCSSSFNSACHTQACTHSSTCRCRRSIKQLKINEFVRLKKNIQSEQWQGKAIGNNKALSSIDVKIVQIKI